MITDSGNVGNRASPWWVGYALTVVLELAVTTGLLLLLPVLPLASFPMLYLLIMMAVSYFFGRAPAILAFVLGFICFAYAFPPYHGIWPPAATQSDWAGLVAFLTGTTVIGIATHMMRTTRGRAETLARELQETNQHTTEALDSLRESEVRYRTLIDTMNEGFATTDADYMFTYVNLRFAEILGYTADEVVGHRIQDFLSEASQATMTSQIAERRAGRFASYELAWTSKDGRTVHTLISPRPLFDEDGRFAGSFGVVTDITDLKRSQEALRISESKYRQLFHNANDAIFLLDVPEDGSPGLFIDVNDVACRRLGYSREELLAMSPPDIDTPESAKTFPGIMDELQKTGHGTFEVVQLTRNGREIPSEISAHLFELGGKKVALAIIRDVTERKLTEERLIKSEERFRNLFERAADNLFLHDLDGRFIEANQTACDTLGYSREELLRLTVSDVVMDYDRGALEELWHKLITSGPMTVNAVHRRKDGSTLLVEGRLSPFEYHDQLLILAVVRDITERMRAEEERRALEQRVEEQKRSFYRETIRSVTGGKLDICDAHDTASYLASSDARFEVDSAAEVSDARHAVEEFCRLRGLEGDRLDSFMVGVGEAITNAVKHGTRGSVYTGARNGTIWVGVEDNGPGIESLILPSAVLLRGFSTKPSLGLGYCLMLDVADQIHLKTDADGTVVILEKALHEQAGQVRLDALADTWDAIPG